MDRLHKKLVDTNHTRGGDISYRSGYNPYKCENAPKCMEFKYMNSYSIK